MGRRVMRTRERLRERDCAWCGRMVSYGGVGRPPVYCGKSCRNRAWEVRSAQRRLGRDIAAGLVLTAPRREVVERTVEVERVVAAGPVFPQQARDWQPMLGELARQLREEPVGREFWAHRRLYDGLTAAVVALDRATPGGVGRLR